LLLPLYPIVDTGVCAAHGMASLDVVAACLRGGATLLQLRVKGGSSGAFLDLARRARELTDAAGARLIVNDRADIAVMAGAAGVHIGQDDLPVDVVRGIVGPSAIVGLSTHTAGQIEAARHEAISYIAVGPVFETGTKETGYAPRGLDLVRDAARTGLPVVAIGGITLESAPSAIDAGAMAVAVISDLFADGDPETRVASYLQRLSERR
jgi:thiamine-phosphate pyrophosphorylase